LVRFSITRITTLLRTAWQCQNRHTKGTKGSLFPIQNLCEPAPAGLGCTVNSPGKLPTGTRTPEPNADRLHDLNNNLFLYRNKMIRAPWPAVPRDGPVPSIQPLASSSAAIPSGPRCISAGESAHRPTVRLLPPAECGSPGGIGNDP
jgi:hypothetical protein